MIGRYAARLYTERRRAIERNVPFWLPGEAGQVGHAPGQDTNRTNPVKTKAGQGGQVVQVTLTATAENETRRETVHPSLSVRDVSPYGHQKCPDHPDHPDQASNGAGSSRSGRPDANLTTLTSLADDRAWCARLGAAGPRDARRVVLREWVEAAGGWSDAVAVHLPASLPSGLALATLKAHARALGLEVHVTTS